MKRKNGYYINGNVYVPAVSKVLKSAGNSGGLLNWAAGLGAQAVSGKQGLTPEAAREMGIAGLKMESERIMGIGTATHGIVEEALRAWKESKPCPQINTNVSGVMAKTIIEVVTKVFSSDDIVALEKSLVTQVYGGTADLIITLTPESIENLKPYLSRGSNVPGVGKCVIDLKTGSYYRNSHLAQVAAYANACDATSGAIINVSRDKPTTATVYSYNSSDLADGYRAFNSALGAWKYFDAPKWFLEQR